MNYNVISDFLTDKEHEIISELTINNRYFPLFLKDSVAKPDSKDGFYFTHTFYTEKDKINSDYFKAIEDIFLPKIKPKKLLRVQYNLYIGTSNIIEHDWHIDYEQEHKGLLYYLNTNNGQTHLLLDETEALGVKSIEKRALFFEPNKLHRSTTCSDKPFRSNIIFNYHV